MDILHLVDRLEELFNESRPIWFTHSVVVNEERMLEIIDQMRISIPDEIKKAQQVLAQRDRILAQAQEEANRTLLLAREKSESMVDRDSVVELAKSRADEIISEIERDNERTRRDADAYVVHALSLLEEELKRMLTQVRNGIQTVEGVPEAAEARDPASASD